MTTPDATPNATEEVARPSVAETLREAIAGTQADLTAIPLRRAVLLLAVPMLIEMSGESLLTIIDIFVVSRVGSDAVATVGLTEGMLSPIYAAAMGLSAAATAMIARRTGEKDEDGASRSAAHVIVIALALSLLLGGVGGALSPRLLGWMGAEPSVVASGTPYTALMFAGSFTIFLLFVVNAVFRAAGDAAAAMRSLWIANVLNIVLAPCLVFGVGPFPRLGVLGAAVAMTLSRGVGVLYQLSLLLRGKSRIAVARRHFAARLAIAREMVKLAVPATMQVLVETASWLGLVRIVSTYGSLVLAGYTIAMRIAIFALLPSWGVAFAASTLVGQNLGAERPDRAKQAVWTIGLYNLAFLGVVSLVFIGAPGALLGLFTHDPAIASVGASCLRIVAVGFVFFAFGMVLVQGFNGAGDTTTPMLVNIASFWFVKLPLAYVLARFAGLGPTGVFTSITIAYGLQSLLSALLFRRGKWMTLKPAP